MWDEQMNTQRRKTTCDRIHKLIVDMGSIYGNWLVPIGARCALTRAEWFSRDALNYAYRLFFEKEKE